MIKNEPIDSLSMNPSNLKEQAYQIQANSSNDSLTIGNSSTSPVILKDSHANNSYQQIYIQHPMPLTSPTIYSMNAVPSSFMHIDSTRNSCDNMNYPSSSTSACSSASSSSQSPTQSNNTDTPETYMMPASSYTSLNKSENLIFTTQTMSIGVNNH